MHLKRLFPVEINGMASADRAMTIATVVVTFNRKALLIECLESLLNQKQPVNRIYLIDNASTDGTPELLKEKGFLHHPLIEYVHLKENTGGAGGFYEGIKLAHEAGYDWIWVMDDDAEPRADALSKLLTAHKESGYPVCSGICGKVLGIDQNIQYAHRGDFLPDEGQKPLSPLDTNIAQQISYASFVGLLINDAAIRSAGYPLKEFFIWFDDIEYCQRLKAFGPIYYWPDSVILHKDGFIEEGLARRVVRLPVKIPFGSQWKFLCGFRNSIYLMMHHGNKNIVWASWMLAKKIIRITIIDPHKFKLIAAYFSYWKQAVGLIPFKTIKPTEWSALK